MEIDIKHIAKLARLSIPEEKVEKFQKEMEGIIEMVENLPDLNTEGALVDPSDTMQLRKDEVQPSFPRDEMLKNAPDTIIMTDDLGLDSLTMVEIVLAVEDAIGMGIDNDEIQQLRTLGDIKEFIRRKITA